MIPCTTLQREKRKLYSDYTLDVFHAITAFSGNACTPFVCERAGRITIGHRSVVSRFLPRRPKSIQFEPPDPPSFLRRVYLPRPSHSTPVPTCSGGYKRVRREWRNLELDERVEWIRAVNCLADLPHDPNLVPSIPVNVSLIPPVNESSSFYDDLVYLHMDLNIKIHWTGFFFPWHRYFLKFFEDALIEKCGYKGAIPYWDWSLGTVNAYVSLRLGRPGHSFIQTDAHGMYNSPFFDNSSSSVGGWGDPENDYQIYTGGFKGAIRTYPKPNHIRRNYTLRPFQNPNLGSPFQDNSGAPLPPVDLTINSTMTKENLEYTVNNFEGNFIEFHTYTESLSGIHPGAHFILGADMTGTCPDGIAPPACNAGPKWTPNDPLFFMHHATVDKVWYDWQQKSPKNKYAYGGGSVGALVNFATFSQFPTGLPPYLNFASPIPGDGLWNVTIWDVMDTTGDTLCYVYA